MRATDVAKFVDFSLKNLGLDYIDMYLIHVPFAFYKDSNFDILQFKNGSFSFDFSTDYLAVWKVS